MQRRRSRAVTISSESLDRDARILLSSLETGPKVEISDSHAAVARRGSLKNKVTTMLPLLKGNSVPLHKKRHNSLLESLTNEIDYRKPSSGVDEKGEKVLENGDVFEKNAIGRRRTTSNIGLHRNRSNSQNVMYSNQRIMLERDLMRRPSRFFRPLADLQEDDDGQNNDESADVKNSCKVAEGSATRGGNFASNGNVMSGSSWNAIENKSSVDGHTANERRRETRARLLPEISKANDCLNIVNIYKRYASQLRTKNSRIMKIKEDAWSRIQEQNKMDDRLLRREAMTASRKSKLKDSARRHLYTSQSDNRLGTSNRKLTNLYM